MHMRGKAPDVCVPYPETAGWGGCLQRTAASCRAALSIPAAAQVFQRLRDEDLDEERGLAMLQYAQLACDSTRLDCAAFKRLCREALDVA